MPNTQVPPDVPQGTFSEYYRAIETHDWYTRLPDDVKETFNSIKITHSAWGKCDCSRDGKLYSLSTLENSSIIASCMRCVRHSLWDLCEKDGYSLSRRVVHFFPQYHSQSGQAELMWPIGLIEALEKPSDRSICTACNSYIYLTEDLGVRIYDVKTLLIQDTELIHARCGTTCYTCSTNFIGSLRKYNDNDTCQSCLDEHVAHDNARWCGWCRNYFSTLIGCSIRDEDLCDECYELTWDCNTCGISRSAFSPHECYRMEDSYIYDYSYRPDPVFYGNDSYYFGLELEVEDKQEWGCNRGAEIVKEFLGDRVYIKHDGSLEDGFEIVSHPHSFVEWKSFNWDFLQSLTRKGFRSWNTHTCGLHVHISRTAFRKDNKSNQAHELRFQKLVYDNSEQVRAIAGRSSEFARFDDTGKLVPKIIHGQSADRYEAINIQNRHTLEVRVFRGSLNERRVLSAIEFLHSAIEYTRDLKIVPKEKQLSWPRYMKYVLDNQDKYENFAQVALSVGVANTDKENE